MQLPHSKTGESSEKDSSLNALSGNEFAPSVASAGAPTEEEQDFSEFMWMANEDLDAFDRKVIREIDEQFGIDGGAAIGDEEEEFLQKMLEEEEERDTVYFIPNADGRRTDGNVIDLSNRMHSMNVSGGEIAAQSNLNPHAAEFVPGQGFQEPPIALPTAVHVNAVAQTAEGGHIYCSPLPAPTLNSMPPCLHTQNLVLSPNNSQQQQQQQQQPHHHQQHQHQQQQQQQQQQRFATPVRHQLNGHNDIRRFFNNVSVPVYMSNVPVFPVMNGSPYVQPPHNRFPNQEGGENRVVNNDDEGYGDN